MKKVEKQGFEWFYLPQEVNIDNIHQIEEEINSCISENKKNIVFDMKNLNHIYSTAIGMLIRNHKNIENNVGRLFMVNISNNIYKIFKTARLDEFLNFYLTDVEFEISIDDVWKRKVNKHKDDIAFFSQIESGIYRIVISGDLVKINNMRPVSDFYPEENIDKCIVDISNVDSIDTCGVNVLVEFIKKLEETCSKCIIFGANSDVSKILPILSDDQALTMCDTEEKAVRIAGA